MMGFGLLIPIILIGVIAYALGWLPPINANRPSGFQNRTPLDILKERYARGEISREEYELMSEDLRR